MDASKPDEQQDFVARQYATIVGRGISEEAARVRIREVLGPGAVEALDRGHVDGHRRVVEAARLLGGDTGVAQAELISALAEARLLALDWWRPIRTFLLYMLFLLFVAAVIATIYMLFVLPAFSHLDRTIGVRNGAAEWIVSHGAVRLLAPLVLMAIALVILAARWLRMRRCMARFEPLGGSPGSRRLSRGRAGIAFQTLRWLEFASAIKASGVADAAVLEPAREAAGWPTEASFPAAADRLREKLAQAQRLGTFGEELQWQRRVHWSTTQAQLELSRDRLTLFARVLFYILVGSMVTVLYLPIFSIASMMGAQ